MSVPAVIFVWPPFGQAAHVSLLLTQSSDSGRHIVRIAELLAPDAGNWIATTMDRALTWEGEELKDQEAVPGGTVTMLLGKTRGGGGIWIIEFLPTGATTIIASPGAHRRSLTAWGE